MAQISVLSSMGNQLVHRVTGDYQRPSQGEASVDELLWAEFITEAHEAVDQRLDPIQVGITQKVGSKVDTLYQVPLSIHSRPVCQPSTVGGFIKSMPMYFGS